MCFLKNKNDSIYYLPVNYELKWGERQKVNKVGFSFPTDVPFIEEEWLKKTHTIKKNFKQIFKHFQVSKQQPFFEAVFSLRFLCLVLLYAVSFNFKVYAFVKFLTSSLFKQVS